MSTRCSDPECWCCFGVGDYDGYYDDDEVVAYDPNHVWHGPKRRGEQAIDDAYGALLAHMLQPILFFDRIVNKEDV